MQKSTLFAILFLVFCIVFVFTDISKQQTQKQQQQIEQAKIDSDLETAQLHIIVIAQKQEETQKQLNELIATTPTRTEIENAIIQYSDYTTDKKIAEAMKQVKHYETEAFCLYTMQENGLFELSCMKN
jgi:chlorite dismutase